MHALESLELPQANYLLSALTFEYKLDFETDFEIF